MLLGKVVDRIRIHRCQEFRACGTCGCKGKKTGVNPCQAAESLAHQCEDGNANWEEVLKFLSRKCCAASRSSQGCNHRGCIATEEAVYEVTRHLRQRKAA
jgi:hypothetical protein